MPDGPQPLFPLPQGPEADQPPSGYPQLGTQRPAPTGKPPGGIPHKVWMIIAAASVVIAVTAAVTLLLGGSDSDSAPTARTDVADSGYSDDNDSDSSEQTLQRAERPSARPGTAVDRFSAAPPPPIVREPDTFDKLCASGFQLSGQSGWGTRSGRGSAQTSCFFADSVLHAYWDQHGSPDETSRVVVAEGTVPCGTTGGECSGDRFVMRCAVLARDTWVTCIGGKDARVYIY